MSPKYIFFDVAQTLLHKPSLFVRWNAVLHNRGFDVDVNRLRRNHKLLSEAIKFPDKTHADFYRSFNAEVLMSLGIVPSTELLDEIFSACTYLEWEPFEDIAVLGQISIPIGIISNWDLSLEKKLERITGASFFRIVGSEKTGFAKPDKRLFQEAVSGLEAEFSEIIYVGDSLKLDMQPALELGLKAMLIDRDDNFPYFSGIRLRSLTELKKHL